MCSYPCVWTYVYQCMCKCVHMCVEARDQCFVSFSVSVHHIFRQYLCFFSAKITVPLPCLTLCEPEDLNPSPQACRARNFPTEPFLQPWTFGEFHRNYNRLYTIFYLDCTDYMPYLVRGGKEKLHYFLICAYFTLSSRASHRPLNLGFPSPNQATGRSHILFF